MLGNVPLSSLIPASSGMRLSYGPCVSRSVGDERANIQSANPLITAQVTGLISQALFIIGDGDSVSTMCLPVGVQFDSLRPHDHGQYQLGRPARNLNTYEAVDKK